MENKLLLHLSRLIKDVPASKLKRKEWYIKEEDADAEGFVFKFGSYKVFLYNYHTYGISYLLEVKEGSRQIECFDVNYSFYYEIEEKYDNYREKIEDTRKKNDLGKLEKTLRAL